MPVTVANQPARIVVTQDAPGAPIIMTVYAGADILVRCELSADAALSVGLELATQGQRAYRE